MSDLIVLVSIISIIVSFVFSGEMDTIRFKPDKAWLQSDFWLGKGKYDSKNRNWFLKYIGSMLSDGWHLCKFIRVYFILIPATFLFLILLGWNTSYFLLWNFITYTFGGMIFEISYSKFI